MNADGVAVVVVVDVVRWKKEKGDEDDVALRNAADSVQTWHSNLSNGETFQGEER